MRRHLVYLCLGMGFGRPCGGQLNEVRFQQVVDKMERDVNELAIEVERLYQVRCTLDGATAMDRTTGSCASANFADCQSAFPQPTCHGGANLNVYVCGNVSTCNSLYDYTVSTVRLPSVVSAPSHTRYDPTVMQAICFSRHLDTWFQAKRDADVDYWSTLGDAPRAMYFGSAATGLMRIYPARHSEAHNCGAYDPRLRPWYIAASSGPKNVLLVLDVSGSMTGLRLEQVKLAATRIVTTLTERDTVNIVVFHTTARLLDESLPYLTPVTKDHRERLVEAIKNLQLGNQTNFLDAFTLAFDVLEASVSIERQACASGIRSNTALIFLTDGAMNVPSSNTTPVLELVNARLASESLLTNRLNVILLAYSVAGADATDIHEFPAQLACAVPYGVWSHISAETEIADSLASYHKLFALGLANANFTAWVEPYTFSTGQILGITVSVPTYDRSVSPPRFLGVAGMDFGLTALVTSLGGTTADIEFAKEETLRLLALESTSKCPVLDLDACELETYRLLQGSNCSKGSSDAMASCDIPAVNTELCEDMTYPDVLWNNTDNIDRSYPELACCSLENDEYDDPFAVTTLSLQCPHPVPTNAPITPSPPSSPVSLTRSNGSQPSTFIFMLMQFLWFGLSA